MNSSLRTSASGMMAQQRMIDVIANNLANVNTTGFKRSRVSFEDVLYETVREARVADAQSKETLAPVQIGKGVRISAVLRMHGQGSPESTNRPLDLSVEGDGLFQLQRPDGSVAYTRDGNFTLDASGALVSTGGYPVLPGITMPADATDIGVAPNGTVSARLAGASEATEVGRIELARFLNPSGLQAIGENQFVATDASGEVTSGLAGEQGFGRVLQGTLESSNVEMVQEMTDMIAAQRAYEINAKAVRTAEEMMQQANDLLR